MKISMLLSDASNPASRPPRPLNENSRTLRSSRFRDRDANDRKSRSFRGGRELVSRWPRRKEMPPTSTTAVAICVLVVIHGRPPE